MANLLKSAAALSLVMLLSGCVIYPYPHFGRTSPDIKGKIVDSDSGAPVFKASVCLADRPKIKTISDADGYFTLPHTRNFYFLHWSTYDGIDTDIPYRNPPGAKLRISHPNYFTLEFAIPEAATNYFWSNLPELRIQKEINLAPASSESQVH